MTKVKKTIAAVLLGIAAALVVLIVVLARHWGVFGTEKNNEEAAGTASSSTSWVDPRGEEFWRGSPELDVQLLTPNEYSRPQLSLDQITGIVVHYTANPGSTAQENRDYFEGLKDGTDGTHVSSHFIVGLDGEIIQCIPSSEMSYASNSANDYTLSIECCHPDETGEFTQATYDSLVKLVGWLCRAFTLTKDGIIRHYDVTGKICPKYFVDHADAWEQFRNDAISYRDSI